MSTKTSVMSNYPLFLMRFCFTKIKSLSFSTLKNWVKKHFSNFPVGILPVSKPRLAVLLTHLSTFWINLGYVVIMKYRHIKYFLLKITFIAFMKIIYQRKGYSPVKKTAKD